MTHAPGGTAGRTARWWVRLAALVGSCVVIVVLAAPMAHAQENLGGDVWKEEGQIPADRYALTMPIGFDPAHGAVVSDDVFERVKRVGDTVMYFVAALFHDLGVMVTRLGLWLLELAFSFTVLEAIRGAADALSRKMQRTFVAGIGLDDFAVFLAVFYCGIQLLRRRTAHGLGELTASLLVAVLGATLVANPLRALDATAMTVRGITLAIMDLSWERPVSHCGPPDNCSVEEPPSATEQGYEIPKSMSDQLYKSMIVEPYDIANWGQVLTGSCARTRDEYLRGEIEPIDDEGDADDAVVRVMWERGCREQVIYNTSMSFNRVGVALLTFVVRVVLLFFNAVLSASVMGGQFMLGQVAIALPLFVVFGTVPGTGRQIALKGLNATGQAGAAVILAGFMLTVLVAFQTALLGLPGTPLLTRYVMVLVMVIMLWRYRGPVRDMVREILLHFTQRLKTHSPGNVSPNLLGDRELWENSVKKRLKENIVDSSYRGTRRGVGKGIRLLRRKRGDASAGGPGAGRGAPTADDGPVRRRTPREYVHDVKQDWQRFGQRWKRRGQTVVNASKKTASVTGKGAEQLATISGKGFRGGLKLSRKGLVGAAGVVGALGNLPAMRETAGDAVLMAGESTAKGAKAAASGVAKGANATVHGVAKGAKATSRGVGMAWNRTKQDLEITKQGYSAVAQRLKKSADQLGRDMSLNYRYRAHPTQTQSAIPGAEKRDTQRKANRRDRDVRSGRFLP